MMVWYRQILLLLILLTGNLAIAQKGEKIELVQANELEGVLKDGQNVRKLIGNVIFKQEGTMLYCDSAFQYASSNSIEAFGRVRMNQADTVNLTSSYMKYNGDTKKGLAKGNVVLSDKTMTLTTDQMEYDLNSKQAFYNNGGTIKDGKSTLTSIRGIYNTKNKLFFFRKNVRIVNPSQNYVLTTDSLNYNSSSKIATFLGPTTIVSQDGIINATEGEYNINTAVATLKGRSKVQSGAYTIEAARMYYDDKKKRGVAKGNVVLTSPKDSVTIYGEEAYYWSGEGTSKIFGNPLMKTLVGGDTVFLSADTLISIDPPEKPLEKRLLAFNQTKIFKSDIQGVCDSLVYNFGDSAIYFYRRPALWNSGNQIIGDTISIELVNNKVNKLNTRMNSFMISQDTLKHYNQVKGRNMVAYFSGNNVSRVDVSGNGESIYFALENDKRLIGMNKVECSNLSIRLEENKVKAISFVTKPDAVFVPPHQIVEPDTRLKGFTWRGKERPTKSEVTGGRN
ncbi:MAG: OstA-like protein [Cytophagaceae bacterium]